MMLGAELFAGKFGHVAVGIGRRRERGRHARARRGVQRREFVVIALVLRSRIVAIPAAILSTALLVLLTIQFASWYWVS